DRLARRCPHFRSAVSILQQGIAEREKRKAAMPDLVEPGRRLWTRMEETGGRKQSGKGQRMNDRCDGGEQIAAGEKQQRPGSQLSELRIQQNGGDEVIDCKRRLVARDESRYWRKRCLRKRRGADEQGGGDD